MKGSDLLKIGIFFDDNGRAPNMTRSVGLGGGAIVVVMCVTKILHC